MNEKKSLFKQGLRDGFPIGVGYFPLAFSLGVSAATGGIKFIASAFMGALSFTGIGEMTMMSLANEMADYLSIFIALLVINLRNIVLSLSMSQRLEKNVSLWKRLIISMGNTDEIYALNMLYKGKVPASYFLGTMTVPYIAWTSGTMIGSVLTTLVPKSICIAMNMALYAMLVAAILPSLKTSKPALFAAISAGTLNFILQGIKPVYDSIKSVLGRSASSWVLVAVSLICASIAAVIWPVEDKEIKKEGESDA